MTGSLLFLCPESGRKEGASMPCPHFNITIVQRSENQSAVSAAAYQSGEKLFSEYDQQQKYYPYKTEVIHREILLPPNAPPEYADRNTLWNAAEAQENNGMPSLPGGSCLPFRGNFPRNSMLTFSVTTAGSFLFPKG